MGTLWRRGLLSKGANPRETLGETQRSLFQLQQSGALLQRLPQVQIGEWEL
jgi:hypothetical protein